MLKRFFCAILFVPILVVAASAQSEWSGFYAGGNVGAALGRSTADTSTVFNPSGYFAVGSVAAIQTAGRQSLSANAFTGGVEAGIQAQSDNDVFGGEIDYDSLRMSDSASTTVPYPGFAATSFTIDQSFKTNWMLTARPKYGRVVGAALIYVTVGLAVTKVDYQAQFSDTFAGASENASVGKTKYGWTGGFGVAFMGPIDHFSMKGEYLYADFGRVTMTSANFTAFAPPISFANEFTHSMALHTHVIRAGFDYHW